MTTRVSRPAPARSASRPGPAAERRLEARRIVEDRMRHRRRRSAVLLLLAAATGLIGIDLARDRTPVAAPPTPEPRATVGAVVPVVARPTPSPSRSPSPSPTFPVVGPGTFSHAAGSGPLLGTGGVLRRFQIAVEDGMGQDPAAFAAAVDRILGDPRSWIASKQLRLQRVPKGIGAEFTIYLATPGTSERMCAAGGLATERYTSCRLPGQVIINVARWLTAVPNYRAPLADYQAYAINHEVGHQFGRGHEACPSPGAKAPVMQQQTLGLRGCLAHGWPYLDGRRYSGATIP